MVEEVRFFVYIRGSRVGASLLMSILLCTLLLKLQFGFSLVDLIKV
jgi:hypothetical protein